MEEIFKLDIQLLMDTQFPKFSVKERRNIIERHLVVSGGLWRLYWLQEKEMKSRNTPIGMPSKIYVPEGWWVGRFIGTPFIPTKEDKWRAVK